MTPTSTFNIVNTTDLINVTRFELRAPTNLVSIPPIIWSIFPNLEEIVMANYATVSSLTITDLMFASKLKLLNLSGNKLPSISYSTFALAPALESLDLSDNLITEIEGMAFQYLSNLKYLDLSFNKLSMLDVFAFSGLTSLEVLNLSHNKLKLVGPSTFNLPSLQVLDCNSNGLKLLPDNLFAALPTQAPPLFFVDFGENKLTHIGSALYTLPELNILNLTANKKIDDINLEALARLPKLETLLLSTSGFHFPAALAAPISPEAVVNLPVPVSSSPVKMLTLDGNKLVDPNVLLQLAYFRQLESLNLEANGLTVINHVQALPTWFPNLRTIFVGNNKLNCAWLNVSIPMFKAANVSVYTIKKTKTWTGSAIYEQKLIDTTDCFDLEKVFNNILMWMSKFSTAT